MRKKYLSLFKMNKMKRIITLSIALILVAGIVSLAKSADIDTVSSDYATGYAKDRHIVRSSNGTIVALYQGGTNPAGIRAKKSTNGGTSWTNLAGGSGSTQVDDTDSVNFSICIDTNDNIYIAYLKWDDPVYDTCFRKLTYSVAGSTWTVGSEKYVVNANSTQHPFIIRETGGTIWVAYSYKVDPSSAQVKANYSYDEFETSLTTTTVNSPQALSLYSFAPALTIHNGSPFIVYTDYFNLWWSSWNGSTWDTPAQIYENFRAGFGEFSVATKGSEVHVVADYNGDIKHTYYNGSTWSTPVTIANSPYGPEDQNPSLTTDNVDMWCFASIYYQDTESSYDPYNIKYKKRVGSTWDLNWTAVTTDNAMNKRSTTPPSSSGHIPLAWTEETPYPYTVKFDYSVVTDETSPATITDLTGLCNNQTGDVTLSWSTPGDDGWTGTLPEGSKYRIDYSTYSIQWSTTTYDVEIPTNSVAPHTQVSHTFTSLTGDTTYYFRIWTADEASNWSGLSNGATVWVYTVGDVTSPAAITDLTGLCNSSTGDVTLSWSTPGDDGWNNTLPSGSGYRIDYSSVTKTWDEDDYEVWIPTSGVAPYTDVSHTITGLQQETTWYFQIWTRDEIPNWSGLSNGATVFVSVPIIVSNYTGGTPIVPPYSVTAPSTGNCLGTFKFAGTGTISQITITEYGSCDANTDLENVKLFQDDGDGNWESSQDNTQLGATTAFSGSSSTATFSSLSLPAGTTTYVHVVLDVKSTASKNDTIGIKISQASDVTATKSVTASSWPVQLGTTMIYKYTGEGAVAFVSDGHPRNYGDGESKLTEDLNQIDNQMGSGWTLDAVQTIGDMTYTSRAGYQSFDDAYSVSDVSTTPVFYCVGNHEIDNSYDMPVVRNKFSGYGMNVSSGPTNCKETTYSYDVQDMHVVVLNEYYNVTSDTGTDGDVVDELFDWLKNDLRSSPKPYKIVLGHEPAYPEVRHTEDSLNKYLDHRNRFWNLLQTERVPAYLAGHEHNYHFTEHDGVFDCNDGCTGGTVGGSGYDTFATIFYAHSDLTNGLQLRSVSDEDPNWASPTVVTKTRSDLETQVMVNTAERAGTGCSYFIDYTADDPPSNPDWTGNNSSKWWENAFSTTTANWSSGELSLGYDTTSPWPWMNTEIDDKSGVYGTFIRVPFTCYDKSSYSYMKLQVDYDDAVIVWLNGVQIYKSPNAPTVTAPDIWDLTASSDHPADGDGDNNPDYTYGTFDVTSYMGYLSEGTTNVLAIGNWSDDYTSDDLAAGVKLCLTKQVTTTNLSNYQAGTPTVPPSYVNTQSTGNCLGTFKFDGTGTVSQITLTEYGTCDAPNDLENVKLFKDDGDGNWESGADTTQLGSTTTFSGASSTATFSGFSLVACSTCYAHVILDVKSTASHDKTIGIEILQASHVTSSNYVSATSWPVQLGTSTIKDALPPEAVTTLSALTGTGQGEIDLSWTAPGDDGWNNDFDSGSEFDIRYSTTENQSPAISTTTFASCSSVSEFSPIPTPVTALVEYNMTVTGLTPGVTYYFAMKTGDEVPNWSGLSNGATAWAQTTLDATSPAAITDLTGLCDTATGDVTLSWSTPGDDGWNNTLPDGSGYRIDYSTYSKQWDKDDYEVWIPTSGVAPNTQVSHTITGLTGETTWYFQIWTRDEIPNWSGLSNGATVWVTAPPSAVTDLAASPGTNQGEIKLSWTAPGDDGNTGPIEGGQYHIKYSSVSTHIWDDMTYEVQWTTSTSPGNSEAKTITGLSMGTTYYFYIETADEVPNWSELSNKATGYVLTDLWKSVQDGVWSSTSTWDQGVAPLSWGRVEIYDTVTYDENSTDVSCSSVTIKSGGILEFEQAVDTNTLIVQGNILIESGGEFLMEPNTGYASIVKIKCASDGQYGIVVQNGGIFDVRGSSMTYWKTTLDQQADSDQNQMVTTDATGWKVGDTVTVGPGTSLKTVYESKITGISDTTITLQDNFPENKPTGSEVVNITRNCVITSTGTGKSYIENLSTTEANFNMEWVEASYLGAVIVGKWGITFNGSGTKGKINYSSIHHGYNGIMPYVSSNNTLTNNVCYANSNIGIYLATASNNTLTNNSFYKNKYGIYTSYSSNNLLNNNSCYSNTNYGIYFYTNSNNNTLTNNSSYSNLYGIYTSRATNNLVIDCQLGKDVNNSSGDIGYAASATTESTLILKDCELYSSTKVATSGIDRAGSYLISYNQDDSTGTVKIWGDYKINSGTERYSYAYQLYSSTSTTPKTMKGLSSASDVKTQDANCKTELITITYDGDNSEWDVEGSISGDLGTITGSPNDWHSSGEEFTLDFTESSPQNGDRVDFVTVAASNDADLQKDVQFGRCASALNSGKSKLTVDTGGTLELVGTQTYPTLVDRISGTTYYTLISTGSSTFTAQRFKFQNLDMDGIQFCGSCSVTISSGTFDYAAQSASTRTYITCNSLTSSATFYNLTFDDTGSVTPYNIYVTGNDTNLSWYISGYGGVRGGEDYDYDPNDKIIWAVPDVTEPAEVTDLAATAGTNQGEIELSWTAPGDDGNTGPIEGGQYHIKYSSDSTHSWDDMPYEVQWTTSTSPGNSEAKTITGLSMGTTYYFYIETADEVPNWSELSNKATGYVLTDLWKSVQDGVWSSTSTWDQGVAPLSWGRVEIYDTVTYDQNSTDVSCSSITVKNAGILQFEQAVATNTLIVQGNILIELGGKFLMEPNTGFASIVEIKCASDGDYGIVVQDGGIFDVRGSSMTYWKTTLAQQANSSQNQMVTTDATGWKVGDRVTVGPSVSTNTVYESKITGISGTTITLEDNFAVNRATASEVVNLTRNCVITSTGTGKSYIQNLSQTEADFNVEWAEASYLGLESSGKYGITFDDSGTRGKINYSSIHNGYYGIMLNSSSNNTLTNNTCYLNSWAGIALLSGSNNTLTNNSCYSNVNHGIYLNSTSDNSITNNNCYANSTYRGIYVYQGSNNTLTGNNCYSNGDHGIMLYSASNNTLENNSCYLNSTYGIYLYSGSNNNTLTSNSCYSNTSHGIRLQTSSNNTLTDNSCYSNSHGIYLSSSSNNTLANNSSYSNSYGIYISQSTNNLAIDCELGKDGNNNSSGDIGYAAGQISTLILRDCELYSTTKVATSGINTAGSYLISYNQDDSTGTVKIWGDYKINSGTERYSYAYQLYSSTSTAPKTMKGSSSASDVQTSDVNCKTELVTITYDGDYSEWDVVGSISGALGSFSGDRNNWGSDGGEFTLDFDETSPQDGDKVDFVTVAASNDADLQKDVQFGPCASALNSGKSKLTVDTGGTLEIVGTESYPTLVDRISGTTYYTLISTGSSTFTAEWFEFQNVDKDGVQFHSSCSVTLSSGTFDYAQAYTTTTYIICNSLTSNATFYNLTFDDTGSVTPYNIYVNGDDSNLSWYIASYGGVRGGEDYDYDPNNKIIWAVVDETAPAAITDLTGLCDSQTGDVTLSWSTPGDDGWNNTLPDGSKYRIDYSTYSIEWSTTTYDVEIPTHSVTPYTNVSHTITGLTGDSTYYFRIWTADEVPNWSGLSNGATVWVWVADVTAPAAITDLTGLCDSQTGDVTLSWSTPGDDGWNNTLPDGSKYRIDYSTYSIEWSTTTYDVEIPTHSVTPYTNVSHTITGLTGDSTYYFRIWTADEVPNWSGLSNGATVWVWVADVTAPAAITDLTGLCDSQTGDVTLSWSTPGDDGWNNTLPDGSKYRIDYSTYSIQWSTTTYDVEIPTHSVTPYTNVSYTITGLTGDSTYYFRIWTADEVPNWSGLSNGATVWVPVADVTAPAAITDLTGLCDSQTGDVTLSWSTPGDDGWNNTLPDGSKYRIDYSTYSIQWSTTTYDVEIPTHSVTPYTNVSHTITDLTGDTTYYFRIWTADEVPNWSGLSNGATVWVPVTDVTAPAAITDLTGLCDSQTGDVTLSWSTPGDDGWNDTLPDGSKYRLDYSTYSIEWSTTTYDVEIPTHSVTPYTNVSHTITDLPCNSTYYFRIWTADEVPNWSGLSNGATVWVPITFVWDGGGANNNWSTALNWSANIVPGENDNVVFDNTSNKPCTIDISTTVASFSVMAGSTITITASGNLTVTGDISLSTGTFNAGSTLITVGGNWSVGGNALFNCETSTITFNSTNDVSTMTITTGGSSFARVVFDSGNGKGIWKLQDNLTCTSLQVTDGKLMDNYYKTVTVNGNIDIANTANILTSTGTWVQGANGNISNPQASNRFATLQIANSVISTRTSTVRVRKLILGTDTTLQGGSNVYIYPFGPPDGNDFIDMGTGSSITNGPIVIYPTAGASSSLTVTQKAFSTFVPVTINYANYSTIQMTGDWTTGNLWIFGGSNTDTEAEAQVLDTNGYNLTVSTLTLGYGQSVTYPDDYYAKVLFSTGTHDISGNVSVDKGVGGTKGYLNLGSANISVAGNWDATNAIITPGTSTVSFDNALSTSTLTGPTTFYVLISTTTSKVVKVSSGTAINVTNHLNFENITLRSTLDGATWYLNLSGSGTQDVSNVDVQDSNASGGSTIIAYGSTNSGNNTNWTFLSGDSTAPAAITDLTGLCDSGTGDVTLSWSTPGDDEWENTLADGSKYRIDYSTYSIQWSTTTYDVEIPTHSVTPYTNVSHTITGLTGDSTYYFRIWTADEVPNWSGLSNGATVWVNPILGISISTDTYNFGNVDCATSTVSGSTIIVTNDGNVTETYSIKCSSSSKWTAQSVPGPNQFTLQSAFHPTEPTDNDLTWKTDDILTDSLKDCTTAVFSIDGTEHGKEVLPFNNNDRKLWFRLKTPLCTSTTDQQTITITIDANKSP